MKKIKINKKNRGKFWKLYEKYFTVYYVWKKWRLNFPILKNIFLPKKVQFLQFFFVNVIL